MPEYDLDYNGLVIGFARIGKSTLALQEYRRKYAFDMKVDDLSLADDYLIQHKFASENIAYSKKQDVKAMFRKGNIGDGFLFDEGYLLADRRESLDRAQVRISQLVNFYANRNRCIETCFQNLSDCDRRWFSKANAIQVIVERGHALLFCGSKNFALFKDLYGFERFVDNPNLLGADYESGVYRLRRLSSYVCDLHWSPLDNCRTCGHAKHQSHVCMCGCKDYVVDNNFMGEYLKVKGEFQSQLEFEAEEEVMIDSPIHSKRGRPRKQFLQ
jgi:ribosomal protein L32